MDLLDRQVHKEALAKLAAPAKRAALDKLERWVKLAARATRDLKDKLDPQVKLAQRAKPVLKATRVLLDQLDLPVPRAFKDQQEFRG